VYLSYHTTHTTKAERRAETQRQRRGASSGQKTKRGIEGLSVTLTCVCVYPNSSQTQVRVTDKPSMPLVTRDRVNPYPHLCVLLSRWLTCAPWRPRSARTRSRQWERRSPGARSKLSIFLSIYLSKLLAIAF